MRDRELIEALRTAAAFKAYDPSAMHLVRLLRTSADRLEHLTPETAQPGLRRGQHDESSTRAN